MNADCHRNNALRLWRSSGTLGTLLAALISLSGCKESNAPANDEVSGPTARAARAVRFAEASAKPVVVEVFAPAEGDRAGVDGIGWFIDLAIDFDGDLRSTGFTGNQLTGPGVHNNVPPMPGIFAPGKDDRFGGLVVLISTTQFGAQSCQNTANLFNLTGVTNRNEGETEIWDTWIIGAASFGRRTASTLFVAEIKDLDHDGIHNDAPDVVPDSNHDGHCDVTDIEELGADSEVEVVNFFLL